MTIQQGLQQTGWMPHLETTLRSEEWFNMCQTISKRREQVEVYPPKEMTYRSLLTVPFDKVRVVIIGQDPYHSPNQANGYAFAVNQGMKAPPSLSNIKKEIELSTGCQLLPTDVTLEGWADQGVLLLNTSLTVERGAPGSHSKIGWDKFVDSVILALSESGRPIVYMFWGEEAKKKILLINRFKPNYILESGHPSPLSAKTFFGRNHFNLSNTFLKQKGLSVINWAKIEKRRDDKYGKLFGI